MTKTKIIIKTIIRAILYQIVTILVFCVVLFICAKVDTNGYAALFLSFMACGLMIFLAIRKGLKEKKELEIARNEELIKTEIIKLITDKDKDFRTAMIDCMSETFEEQKKLKANSDYLKDEAYTKFLSKIIQDGRITDDEKYVLHYLETEFKFSDREIKSNRLKAYMIAFEWATKDKELTESEENVLRNIFSQLEINADDVEEEQNFIADLSLARKLKSQELSPIKVPFNLNQDEQCYFSIQYVALYASRQINYEYYPHDKPEKEGKFYITNKRIIISSPREYSWLLTGITNIEIYNSRFIQMKVMRKKRPYLIFTNKPYLLKTVIEKYLNKLR